MTLLCILIRVHKSASHLRALDDEGESSEQVCQRQRGREMHRGKKRQPAPFVRGKLNIMPTANTSNLKETRQNRRGKWGGLRKEESVTINHKPVHVKENH